MGAAQIQVAVAAAHAEAPVVRIEAQLGWFDLRLRELWAYRELLYFLVWRDIKVRYRQTVIGVVWVVLQPLMTMGVFTLFFGRLAKLPSQGLPYPVFYFAALVPWAYFSSALSNCTNTMVENQHVITKVYSPRLVLPLAKPVLATVAVLEFLAAWTSFLEPLIYLGNQNNFTVDGQTVTCAER